MSLLPHVLGKTQQEGHELGGISLLVPTKPLKPKEFSLLCLQQAENCGDTRRVNQTLGSCRAAPGREIWGEKPPGKQENSQGC